MRHWSWSATNSALPPRREIAALPSGIPAPSSVIPAPAGINVQRAPMRALGVDLGSKRIGIAVSDAGGILASPLTMVQRSGDVSADHRRIADLVVEEEAECVVVGLPVDLRGEKALAAKAALAEVESLATVVAVPVHTYDERMTTAAAAKALRASGVGDSRKLRTKIDQAAAAVMLQGWLDAR